MISGRYLRNEGDVETIVCCTKRRVGDTECLYID